MRVTSAAKRPNGIGSIIGGGPGQVNGCGLGLYQRLETVDPTASLPGEATANACQSNEGALVAGLEIRSFQQPGGLGNRESVRSISRTDSKREDCVPQMNQAVLRANGTQDGLEGRSL